MTARVEDAQVLTRGWLWIKVCVPDDWPEREIERFADFEVEPEPDEAWRIDPHRKIELCEHREGFVHVRLEL